MLQTLTLGNTNEKVPVLGQGTWKMGRDPAIRSNEVEALRTGIEHGATLIDTAEVYTEGESERIVADAIRDCRDRIFLVTKVWPTNGTYDGVRKAVQGSLKRLGTDRIDLYLLHWPSADHPLSETMRGMRSLVEEGIIRYVGVSNFSPELMQEAQEALGDIPLVCNQVGYHLQNRVIERAVMPHCNEHAITVMAYSPFGAGSFPEPGTAERKVLDDIGAKYGKTAFQVTLNWIVARGNVIAIPKAASKRHAAENAAALEFTLSDADIALIDRTFPVGNTDFVVKRV